MCVCLQEQLIPFNMPLGVQVGDSIAGDTVYTLGDGDGDGNGYGDVSGNGNGANNTDGIEGVPQSNHADDPDREEKLRFLNGELQWCQDSLRKSSEKAMRIIKAKKQESDMSYDSLERTRILNREVRKALVERSKIIRA